MKRIVLILTFFSVGLFANASNMFDDNGNYSGNWKQMTNVNTSSYQKRYDSSAYSSSAWQANNQRQQAINRSRQFSPNNYTQTGAAPFRYNTLDYTRVRKVKGGYGDYSARCHDIGDASFCR